VTAPASFKVSDLTRALKGAVKAGMPVARARITPDGSIDIIFGEAESLPPSGKINPLDLKYGTKS
jgi:hypothetical protein